MSSNLILFEPLISTDDAASLLGIHRNTALLWVRQKRLPAVRVGRKVMFRASALNLWLETQYAGGIACAA